MERRKLHILILSLLMAFGGHGHPQCSVLLSGPMKISGVDIPNFCIGPGIDVAALNPEEGTILLYVNALGEHVKCLHTECLNVPVPKPYPLWRMEAQHFISGTGTITDLGPCSGDICPQEGPIFTRDCINCQAPDPIDVSAVQEPNSFHCKACPPGIACFDNCIPEANYTCTDKSRSLESSVDGLKHWCHRMSQ